LSPAIPPKNPRTTLARPKESQQQADKGRLAGSIGAEKSEDLSFTDVEIDGLNADPRAVMER
jgi:hypothetical protein